MLIFIAYRVNNTQFMGVASNCLFCYFPIVCSHQVFPHRKMVAVEVERMAGSK